MKKSLTAVVAVLLLAGAGAAPAQIVSGAWIGAEGAYEDYGDKFDDVTAAISAGYDYVINDRILVGGAVRGTVAGLDKTNQVNTGNLFVRTRLENKDQFGFSARVGLVFATQWLAYLQGEFDTYDVETTVTRNAEVCAPPTNNCITTTRAKSDKELWGGGAGIEYAPIENLRLRAFYSYAERRDVKRDRAGLAVAWKF